MKVERLLTLALVLLLTQALMACRSTTSLSAAPEAAPAPSPVSSREASPPSSSEEETEEAEEAWSNTLKWSTASEVDNFGYDIYRGDQSDGPFERLTAEPIEGAGTTDEVSRYEFVDDTIDPSKVYYYYIESISMEGVRERFTPVGKKEAKIPPAEVPPG